MTKNQANISVIVQRGSTGKSKTETYQVPAYKSQTVLDVVAWIQQNSDPTLSYRYACRVGMCGSCAMTVNGVPRWTCRTHVGKVIANGKLVIEPLRNLPVIKDLAVDLDPFFAKWIHAEGFHHPSNTRQDGMVNIDVTNEKRQEADAGIECINCAVCYSACDTVTGNPEYLGPAALQRAWTLYNDAKDAGKQSILQAVSGTGGCHNCHSQGSCSLYCPNELNPNKAIAGLKRETVSAYFQGEN